MSDDETTQSRRDTAASAPMTCPLGCGRLQVAKPRYGWGSMGAQMTCPKCRLQVRLPWQPLFRALMHRTRTGWR